MPIDRFTDEHGVERIHVTIGDPLANVPEPGPTPAGKLRDSLLADLGVAIRHCERVQAGGMEPSRQVIAEIRRSVVQYARRIQRDIPLADES